MLFWDVFIAAEVRAAEVCGLAFFNLAMLSDATGRRGGATTCHSILNLKLYVYDNSSLMTRCKILHGAGLFEATTHSSPLKEWTKRKFQGKKQ